MKIKINLTLLFLFISSFTFAQIWVDSGQTLISSPAVDVDDPEIFYSGNGEFGCFYFWSTGSGGKDGLAFRRLDTQGKPIGPQKFVFSDADRKISIYECMWANGYYFVLCRVSATNTLHLLKVSEMGKLVKRESIRMGDYQRVTDSSNMVQHGNKLYFTFVIYKGDGSDPIIERSGPSPSFVENVMAYLGVVDLTASNSLSITKLPIPNIPNYEVHGLSADADNVILLEQSRRYEDDWENANSYFRKIDGATGKIGKSVKITAFGETDAVDGPIYNGKGFLIYASQDKAEFEKNSWILDSDTNIILGPNRMEGSHYYSSISDFELAGDTTVFEYYNSETEALSFFLLGKKGKHSKTIYFVEDRPWHYISDGEIGVSGTDLICVYELVSRGAISQGIYSKSISNPKPLKEHIYFLQVSKKEYGAGKKLVRWSALGANSVSLKFAGKTVDSLPPAYSYIVDAVGNNPVAELVMTKADGTTVSRKIKLK